MTKKKKVRIIRIVLLLGTIVSLFTVPWVLVRAWIVPLPDTVQEQVDEALDYGFEGMIVYVDEAGEAPAFYAGGWHDRDHKIPANPHALFKIASINKLYVAVAITKLVNDQRLSLDKTVAEYFPELVGRIENAEKITLRMMVQHRSGLPNFTDAPDYWSAPPLSFEEKLELALDLPADFEPGEDYAYCNTNYLLLAEIMDRELGYPSFEFIRAEILTPLNLRNTFASLDEVNIDDVMSGYYVGYDEDLKTEPSGMLATAEEVGTFVRAINDGSVFEAGEAEIYATLYEYGHGGLMPGYMSLAEYHEDIDAVVVQFINTTDFNDYHWNLSEIIYNRMVEVVRRAE